MSLVEPTIFEKHKTACIIAGLVAILIIAAVIFWAYPGGGKDETPLITNIGIDEGKNAVIANLVANQQQVVNNAANSTNQAIGDLRNSVNRDSSQFNGKGAGDRFCRDFPDDSTCKH